MQGRAAFKKWPKKMPEDGAYPRPGQKTEPKPKVLEQPGRKTMHGLFAESMRRAVD